MWYVSGNRDEEVIADPNAFNIERENVRRHLSFGFVHSSLRRQSLGAKCSFGSCGRRSSGASTRSR